MRRKIEKYFPGREYKHGYFHQGQYWSFVIVGIIFLVFVFVFDAVTLSPRSWLIVGSKPLIATKQLPARGLNNRRSDSLSHQPCLLVCFSKRANFRFLQLINRDSQILFCLFCPQGGGYPQIDGHAENFAFKGGRRGVTPWIPNLFFSKNFVHKRGGSSCGKIPSGENLRKYFFEIYLSSQSAGWQ